MRGHLLALCAVFGCAPKMPSAPSMGAPVTPVAANDGLSRCKVAASSDRPLVTEWPASEKANLESQMGQGGVVVSYSGCKMRVLSQCIARGEYKWRRTTPATDTIEIKNEDDLYAKLPLGAASLQGELEASGQLLVQTTVAGYMRLDSASAAQPSLEGSCADATHVLSGLAIGAFELKTGGTSKATVEAKALGGSAGGARNTTGQVIRRAGDADQCSAATNELPEPRCASPVQMFLLPLAATDRTGSPGTTGAGTGMSPGGAAPPAARDPNAPLPLEIRSDDPDVTWNVMIDGKHACKTPCSQSVAPTSVIQLREDRMFLSRKAKVTYNNLREWSSTPGVRIEANGSPFWSLPGLVRLGGLFYTLVGVGMAIPCFTASDEDSDLYCTATGLTLAVGIPLFAVGTWVMDSKGSVETSPMR